MLLYKTLNSFIKLSGKACLRKAFRLLALFTSCFIQAMKQEACKLSVKYAAIFLKSWLLHQLKFKKTFL